MRRSGPPKRRKPLGRSQKRAVPVNAQPRRAKPPRRSAPPPPVSPAVREMVIQRATDVSGVVLCDRCGNPITGEFSVHHRDPRGMGGSRNGDPHHPANLLAVDGSGVTGCHGHIESHRTEAYEQGFLIRGTVATPETTPVFRHLQTWVIPGDGVWIPSEAPEDLAA
jgi:hypothetical protein